MRHILDSTSPWKKFREKNGLEEIHALRQEIRDYAATEIVTISSTASTGFEKAGDDTHGYLVVLLNQRELDWG